MKGRVLILLLVLLASYAVHFLYTGLPVITGFVSKVVCSGHYISHREVQDCFYDTINPFAKLVTLEGMFLFFSPKVSNKEVLIKLIIFLMD